MKPSEATILLATIARTDQRTVSETTARSWAELMTEADVPLGDAIEAVKYHFGHNADYLMPIHIINRVKEVRQERLARAGTPPMPGDLTWQQEKAWRQLWCANVKDGLTVDAAAAAASEAMNLPRELPPGTSDAVAAERKALVQKLADSKAAPKPEPEQRKPIKPREKWGCWYRGSWQRNDQGEDVIIFGATGDCLFMGIGPWHIPIAKLRDDLKHWLHRASERGYHDSATLTQLALAWCDLVGADEGKRGWAIAMVSDVIAGVDDDATLNRAHPTGGGV